MISAVLCGVTVVGTQITNQISHTASLHNLRSCLVCMQFCFGYFTVKDAVFIMWNLMWPRVNMIQYYVCVYQNQILSHCAFVSMIRPSVAETVFNLAAFDVFHKTVPYCRYTHLCVCINWAWIGCCRFLAKVSIATPCHLCLSQSVQQQCHREIQPQYPSKVTVQFTLLPNPVFLLKEHQHLHYKKETEKVLSGTVKAFCVKIDISVYVCKFKSIQRFMLYIQFLLHYPFLRNHNVSPVCLWLPRSLF